MDFNPNIYEKPKSLICRIRHKYYLNKMIKELNIINQGHICKTNLTDKFGFVRKPKAPKKGAIGEKRF